MIKNISLAIICILILSGCATAIPEFTSPQGPTAKFKTGAHIGYVYVYKNSGGCIKKYKINNTKDYTNIPADEEFEIMAFYKRDRSSYCPIKVSFTPKKDKFYQLTINNNWSLRKEVILKKHQKRRCNGYLLELDSPNGKKRLLKHFRHTKSSGIINKNNNLCSHVDTPVAKQQAPAKQVVQLRVKSGDTGWKLTEAMRPRKHVDNSVAKQQNQLSKFLS